MVKDVISGPYETKKLRRDGTFGWAVTVYTPGVASLTKNFDTRELANAYRATLTTEENQ